MAYKGKRDIQLKTPENSSSTLTAVALQDHWSRTLGLGNSFGPRKVNLGPAARAKHKPQARSVIDTGLQKQKKKLNQAATEKEYVLDEKPAPLTLAQKYGLVHAPKPLLSEQEWGNVKEKSNKREDSGEPCVICKEDFGLQEQVLLSCTHVFHRACLQAFERFTGKKTCPMCRHESYQTRVIHEGAKIHRHKCATIIQSLWRGYVVRCWYTQLRETVPPKDPNLRKKFYESKMSNIVDRMIKSLDVDIGQFLQEMESSVRQSRAVFSQWDAAHNVITPAEWDDIQLRAVARGIADCPICLTGLHNHNEDTGTEGNITGPHVCNAELTRKNKDKRLLQKLTRDTAEDLLLFPDINSGKPKPRHSKTKLFSTEVPDKGAESHKRKPRSTALLSCTHVFHATCLQTLEDIAMLDMKNTCPVCRAHYQKKVINV